MIVVMWCIVSYYDNLFLLCAAHSRVHNPVHG